MSDHVSPLQTTANQAAWDAFCDQFLLKIQPEPADPEVPAVSTMASEPDIPTERATVLSYCSSGSTEG